MTSSVRQVLCFERNLEEQRREAGSMSSYQNLLVCAFRSAFLKVCSLDPWLYEPSENLDPAQADIRKNITCLGNRPSMQFPFPFRFPPFLPYSFNPNERTMQSLCGT